MKTYIIIILISLIALLLIKTVKKNRNKEESKLSIFEHPSTFKKPDIEMVNKTFEEVEKINQIFELKFPDKKTD